MKNLRDYTVAVLQDLIKTNKDEYLLFEVASHKSEDAELKSLLVSYAGEIKECINKLETEVLRLGGCSDTNKNDSENSTGFYKPYSFEKNRGGLISECLKKDDLNLSRYFYAIRKNIMWEVVPLVAGQYFGLKCLHDQIRNIYLEKSEPLINQLTNELI